MSRARNMSLLVIPSEARNLGFAGTGTNPDRSPRDDEPHFIIPELPRRFQRSF
jgi:hypothetical protein